jgi:hypothetical protein
LDAGDATDIEVAALAVWLDRAPSWSPVRRTRVPADFWAQSSAVMVELAVRLRKVAVSAVMLVA